MRKAKDSRMRRELRAQLIQLGKERPELRKHIRPVLARMTARDTWWDHVIDAKSSYSKHVLDILERKVPEMLKRQGIDARRKSRSTIDIEWDIPMVSILMAINPDGENISYNVQVSPGKSEWGTLRGDSTPAQVADAMLAELERMA